MPLRFGLAFSGGGFRGAYHAGFLLAMERHGLRPVAVSGASVGALNAVLLRYLSAEEMCRYWLERATFRSMYRIRPVGIAARAISLVLLLPWLLANVHGARDRPGNSRARMIADVEVGIGPDILYTAWRTPIFQ